MEQFHVARQAQRMPSCTLAAPSPPPFIISTPAQVTLPLERFASRVAASLCNATGLGSEMVVASQREYEDRVRGGAGCGWRCVVAALLQPPAASPSLPISSLACCRSHRCVQLPRGSLRRQAAASPRNTYPHAQTIPPSFHQAVELGLDAAKRASLRARLQAARDTCPLFDTRRWVREQGCQRSLPCRPSS